MKKSLFLGMLIFLICQLFALSQEGTYFTILANKEPLVEMKSGDLLFARARLDASKIERCEKDRVVYRDGSELLFSTEGDFIRVDIRLGNSSGQETVIHSFIPFTLEWTENAKVIKAFGSAGLTNPDNNPGSYTFLSVVEPSTRNGLVAGWTTAHRGSGVFQTRIENGHAVVVPRLDYGRLVLPAQTTGKNSEILLIGRFNDCRFGLEKYADAIAKEHHIQLKRNPTGYCTWYSDKFGGACNQEQLPILANKLKEEFGSFGFDFVQIDDLWQSGTSKNGPCRNFTTWNPNGPYSKGMKQIADAVNGAGMTAGIWFMPFAGTFDDPWFADKQDFFVRSAIDYPESGKKNTRLFSSINQKKGAPYESFWGGTSLDMTQPKVRDYLTEIVKRIKNEWGLKYFKVDGLWTGMAIEQLYINNGLRPDDIGQQLFHDRFATNIEAYRIGIKTLRNAAGSDVFILGCNVSQNMRMMAPSFGMFDAMRIGPDNGSKWNEIIQGPWHGSNRYFLNGRVWWNDPDPVYTRASIPLNHARAIASWVALTGQLYALSDWVPDLPPERIDLIRKTIPSHQKTNVRPVDLFDVDFPKVWHLSDTASGTRRDLLGLFNWNEKNDEHFSLTAERIGLPVVNTQGKKVEKYIGYDFWQDELVGPFTSLDTTVPGGSCRIIAIRCLEDHPILLSTSRHITQGMIDVQKEEWLPETKTLRVTIQLVPDWPVELRIYDPITQKIRRETVRSSQGGLQTFEFTL